MPTTFERELQQAAIDSDFRRESVKFGVEQLPESVQEQDQRFFELLNDGMQAFDGLVACRQTCVTGFTIACDGATF
jgi:hypothetical protein